MLSSKDYQFYYNGILSFSVIHKYGNISNFHNLPEFKKIIVMFSSIKIDNFNSPSFFNYPYFIKFFLGVNAYFLSPKANFHLGVTTYSIKVISLLKQKQLFFFLNFFCNDLMLASDEFIHFFSKKSVLYSFTLNELSYFGDKKTNVGLFNLSTPFHFKLLMEGVDSSTFLLTGLKINLN
tara:strand:+ start:214 stop:750 length:537 start_codon:yes stop_codon:yes gene_type:complete